MIAILAGMLLPALSRAKEMGKRIVCASNQKQVFQVCSVYMDASNGFIPPQYLEYVNGAQIWLTPVLHDLAGLPYKNGDYSEIFFCPNYYSWLRPTKDSGYLTDMAAGHAGTYLRGHWGFDLHMGLLIAGRGTTLPDNKKVFLNLYSYIQKIKRPSSKIYLTENHYGGAANRIEYMRKIPGQGIINGAGANFTGEYMKDMMYGRHNRTVNCGWFDGHVSNIASQELVKDRDTGRSTDALKSAAWLKYWYY